MTVNPENGDVHFFDEPVKQILHVGVVVLRYHADNYRVG